MSTRALALALFAAMAATHDVAAEPSYQEPDNSVEAQTRSLAAEIRCPVCRGVSIEESPSDFAREMKAVIREKVEAGESRDEIRGYFADRYGEWVLLDPERSGVMLSLWVMPLGALVLGGVILLLNSRRWLRQSSAEEHVPRGPLPGQVPAREDAR